jgi:hypothetical protein
MTVFDNFKTKNIDELAEWLNEYGMQDFAPWDNWFDSEYCCRCEAVEVHDADYHLCHDYGWCEINGKCIFFQDMDETPWGKQIVKMWLESEV